MGGVGEWVGRELSCVPCMRTDEAATCVHTRTPNAFAARRVDTYCTVGVGQTRLFAAVWRTFFFARARVTARSRVLLFCEIPSVTAFLFRFFFFGDGGLTRAENSVQIYKYVCLFISVWWSDIK